MCPSPVPPCSRFFDDMSSFFQNKCLEGRRIDIWCIRPKGLRTKLDAGQASKTNDCDNQLCIQELFNLIVGEFELPQNSLAVYRVQRLLTHLYRSGISPPFNHPRIYGMVCWALSDKCYSAFSNNLINSLLEREGILGIRRDLMYFKRLYSQTIAGFLIPFGFSVS